MVALPQEHRKGVAKHSHFAAKGSNRMPKAAQNYRTTRAEVSQKETSVRTVLNRALPRPVNRGLADREKAKGVIAQ